MIPDKSNGYESPENKNIYRRFKYQIEHTELWQIFVVRARQDLRSMLFYLLIIFPFGAIGWTSFVSYLTPPVQFDDLLVENGTLVRFVPKNRRSSAAVLVDVGGKRMRFEVFPVWEEEQNIKKNYNNMCTIYYRKVYGTFLMKVNSAYGIKVGDEFVLKNTGSYERELQSRKFKKIAIPVCLSASLFLLLKIYRRNRNDKSHYEEGKG